MVMTAMMGLTTQNCRVAWRTHYNSEDKQASTARGGGRTREFVCAPNSESMRDFMCVCVCNKIKQDVSGGKDQHATSAWRIGVLCVPYRSLNQAI